MGVRAMRAGAVVLALAVPSVGCGGAAERPVADAGPPPASAPPIQPRLEIELPKAAAFKSGEMLQLFAVEIDGKGAVFIDEKPVTDGEIVGSAKAAHARDPASWALIRADQTVGYRAVIHVMDLIKQGGIAQIAFAVSPGAAVASATPMPAPGGSPLVPPPTPPVAPARPRNRNWNCPFPAEADKTKTDEASVTVIISVDAAGAPTAARVLGDAAPGFGAAALRCAVGERYEPATEDGKPVRGETPPIRVRFTR